MLRALPDPSTSRRDPAARLAALLPGLGLAFGAALLAFGIHRVVHALSPMLVAIVLGALLGNLTSLGREIPAALAPGLSVAGKPALRLGIVLLGVQLVLGDILDLGWAVVAGAVVVVIGGIAATVALGRLLRVSDTQTLLIAGGFSICGAAAVAGVDGVLHRRKQDETATAIALVVLFGTGMIAVVPALSHVLGLAPRTAGVWAGASIHEVAQVVAAGGILGAASLKVAVVVKLARVLMLAPVLAFVSWRQRAAHEASGDLLRPPLVPVFVLGFLAAVLVRSTGLLGPQAISLAATAQAVLLAAAMFTLGLSVHSSVLRRSGWRCVALAAAATLVVSGLGLATALLA